MYLAAFFDRLMGPKIAYFEFKTYQGTNKITISDKTHRFVIHQVRVCIDLIKLKVYPWWVKSPLIFKVRNYIYQVISSMFCKKKR